MTLLAVLLASATFAADPPLNTPPPGYMALFNGKDLTGWSPADDAEKHWTIKNGILNYDGKGKSLKTAKDYGDIDMYVDWKIGPMADSGIYLRGKPQVQIWDKPDVGSGGLYNNKKNPSKPTKIVDRPLGEWNTFHIIMKGDKVTVYLNGEKVVDNVPLENWPTYEGTLPATGTIELQHHQTPLEFRNIYMKELNQPWVREKHNGSI